MARTLVAVCALGVAVVLPLALVVSAEASKSAPSSAVGGACPATVPPQRKAPRGPAFGPSRFNYGNRYLRAHLYWPHGTIVAAPPGRGFMAPLNPDGSIYVKLGWWRGLPGRLVITGRRLHVSAPPLRADVPPNESYGDVGFIPSGLTFPTVGCWRVVGKLGGASLTFVVRVTKVKRSAG